MFRATVRQLIAAGIPPKDVAWRETGQSEFHRDALPASGTEIKVPARFVQIAREVTCHSDPERFALLYQLLWRLGHGEPALLSVAADPLVHRLGRLSRSVRRDAHKMTAFVRFRKVGGETEQFVAWFEPDHHILGHVAPFFVNRFAAMMWAIMTPRGSLIWQDRKLSFGPPVNHRDIPAPDLLEVWWKSYYRATFNPARANLSAMRAEMPKKYWRNLPEAPLIPQLLSAASGRTSAMIAAEPGVTRRRISAAAPADQITPPIETLHDLARAVSQCQRCPLFEPATQPVFGEGPVEAGLAFVGEQPGDQEDLVGRPFVGPAGQLFDRALDQAGIDRSRTYVTNAVKHFKFMPRGKRRLHQKPNIAEIETCKWWLDREIGFVQPSLVVALGATAGRALLGRDITISRERGVPIAIGQNRHCLITVHPSYLLRLPDEAARQTEFRRFVTDLEQAASLVPASRRT